MNTEGSDSPEEHLEQQNKQNKQTERELQLVLQLPCIV